MHFWFQDRRIAIPIILAIATSILFGHFLGNLLMPVESLQVIGDLPDKDIYLLQSGVYVDEQTALFALAMIREKGVEGIVVKEFNHYYLYHDIATDPEQFNELTEIFDREGIPYLVKERNLYRYLERLNDEHDPTLMQDYEFYLKSMEYYYHLLDHEPVEFGDEYLLRLSKTNHDVFNPLFLLNAVIHTPMATYYKLLVYRALSDALM